jgi:uridine kinase
MMATNQLFIPKTSTVTPIPGDMVGDRPLITEHHHALADALMPYVFRSVNGKEKAVVAVAGPSGSGKSETASLIAGALTKLGMPAYTLSCDNYPHKPPRTNEKYREELFSQGGSAYLKDYLGTQNEINFARMAQLVADFKTGETTLSLRIMDNPGNYVLDDNRELDCRKLRVLVMEGTWSNLVDGPSIKVFLYATPEETLAHRNARGRDPGNDTEVLRAILAIEQARLEDIAKNVADVVVSRQCQIIRAEQPLEDQAASLAAATISNTRSPSATERE